MEIMEDGNLVDRVRILLQRDMQYYQVLLFLRALLYRAIIYIYRNDTGNANRIKGTPLLAY